jgi:hypothetical protein
MKKKSETTDSKKVTSENVTSQPSTPFKPRKERKPSRVVVEEEQEAVRELANVDEVEDIANKAAINVDDLERRKGILNILLEQDEGFKQSAEMIESQTHVTLEEAANSLYEHGTVAEAIEALHEDMVKSVSNGAESSADVSTKSNLVETVRRTQDSADDQFVDSVINFNSTTEMAVNLMATQSNRTIPKTPSVGGSKLQLKNGGFNSGPSELSSVIQNSQNRDSPGFGTPTDITKVGRFSLANEFTEEALSSSVRKGSVSQGRGGKERSNKSTVPYGDLPLTPKKPGVGREILTSPRGNRVGIYVPP